ncbi:MAG TPA: S8/S53 family peptidase [Thermoanaerobaculia bacterium]
MSRRVLIALLVLSGLLNLLLYTKARPHDNHATWTNANSRRTYFSVHDIAGARALATGKGVKVGVIDHYFGYDANRALYAGGKDFLGDADGFRTIGEHGLWMATTLREIAPDVEIYALNATTGNETKKVAAMVAAIRWAIDQKLDILTYSDRAVSPANRAPLDAAVADAVRAGVTCIFIHYTHPDNILPLAMFASEEYDRPADVNVWGYDYNVLFVREYFAYLKKKEGTRPYLSVSSTSVVTAGIAAMMKEAGGALAPREIRRILIETSRPCSEADGGKPTTVHLCPHVIDAAAAVRRARDARVAAT